MRPSACLFFGAGRQPSRRWVPAVGERDCAAVRILALSWPVHLQRQIESLKQKILFVGTLVEEAMPRAISALVNRDRNLARTVIDEDAEIDRMEVDVEEEVLKTLALYQPVAADLRFVVAVLKINNDLERMGDLAKNIAKRVLFLTQCERIDLPGDFRSMADQDAGHGQAIARRAGQFRSGAGPHGPRAPTTRSISCAATSSKRSNSRSSSIPTQTECLMRLTSVSRHLERIADMATNIAEDVIYMVEGEIVRHNRRAE